MKIKFLRRTWYKYSKLGKGRKKKQVWRRPTGRDNKMREKRKGYGAVVNIGYGTSKKDQKKIILINNLRELKLVAKSGEITLGKVGKMKKLKLIQEAQKRNIKILNVNEKKFLEKNIKTKKEEPVKESKPDKEAKQTQ